MNLNEYQQICKLTAKHFDNKDIEIMNWGLGISGEAGDVASCIKKTVTHGNDQTKGTKENLGDTMWYIAMICNYYDWNMDDVLKENVDKLSKRFPNGWEDVKAQRNNTMIDWSEK